MICSPGTTPTCEPTSKTCRKCVTGCGRTKGLVPAKGTVWSTNLVTLAVYVHRIPCRCSSGAHREGTMLVPNMGHDVGNPYTKRWTVRRDPQRSLRSAFQSFGLRETQRHVQIILLKSIIGPYIPQRSAGVCTGASQYLVNSSSRRTRVMEQPAISKEVM